MKPKIKEVIVVEGRYDKNTLSQVVDAVIVETGGFAIFKQKERLAFFRRLAKERGLIILTDSDGAGFVIRNYLKGAVEKDQLKQAYIPDIAGKEKRKKQPGKEGKLGVEGMTPEIILQALRRSGATFEEEEQAQPRQCISKADMLEKGLVGPGSDLRRRELARTLQLPQQMTANALLEALNVIMDREEFMNL